VAIGFNIEAKQILEEEMGIDFVDDDMIDGGQSRSQETAAERLSREKEQITNKVADAAEEIERLRMRQEELEHEKSSLEELNRKQDEYIRGKKDIIENLSRNIILMESDEVRANRIAELLSVSRSRFKEMLSEIREIQEDGWGEELEEELDKALALIESTRMEFSKTIAKVDAESWQKGSGQTTLATLDERGRISLLDRGFLFWLKLGLAFTLPIVFMMLLLFAAYLWASGFTGV
jgi:small-conductance mechanosensitive channel